MHAQISLQPLCGLQQKPLQLAQGLEEMPDKPVIGHDIARFC